MTKLLQFLSYSIPFSYIILILPYHIILFPLTVYYNYFTYLILRSSQSFVEVSCHLLAIRPVFEIVFKRRPKLRYTYAKWSFHLSLHFVCPPFPPNPLVGLWRPQWPAYPAAGNLEIPLWPWLLSGIAFCYLGCAYRRQKLISKHNKLWVYMCVRVWVRVCMRVCVCL